MLNLPARSTSSGLGWSFSSRGRGSSVVNRLLLHPGKSASVSEAINVELSDDDDNEDDDDDTEYSECDNKTRPISPRIGSVNRSCGSSCGTTSHVTLDRLREPSRVEVVEGALKEPLTSTRHCKPEPNIPPGLEQVAVKMQQATEIMETQLYKGLAEFRASMQWLSKTEGTPSQVHPLEASATIEHSMMSPADNQNSCHSVLPTSISSLSPSHSAFLVTLAETLQLAVRAAEKLLQQAYADLRVLKERKSVIADAQQSIQQTEKRLEYLLATIQLFSSLRPPQTLDCKGDTVLRSKGPFRMGLPDIAEEEETAVVDVDTSRPETFS